VPNLDPLAGRSKATAAPVKPAPPIREERMETPRPDQFRITKPTIEIKPQTSEEPARKGKKGKSGNPD
jgi:hypothetical protein